MILVYRALIDPFMEPYKDPFKICVPGWHNAAGNAVRRAPDNFARGLALVCRNLLGV